MNILLIIIAGLVVSVVSFFVCANYRTRTIHAGFKNEDVQLALAELVSETSCCLEEWDLFLAWPIDDSYLESIRQKCRAIANENAPRNSNEDLSEDGIRRVKAILDELVERA